VKNVTILGSTGSIGTQTLEVVAARRDRFKVLALGAGGHNLKLLAQQTLEFGPELVGIAEPDSTEAFVDELEAAADREGVEPRIPAVVTGDQANEILAKKKTGIVLNAITGSAGLLATLAALKAMNQLALANKESLVIGGPLVTQAAAPGQMIAVDSEHSAIAQALRAGRREEISKVILTASGGPFRGMTAAELETVTPEQAMHHPTWNMGRVITINSATLVNKGLELLEASLLYDVPLAAIQVVVHPQSVIHSGVEFFDGASILQASPPDMKLPIGRALTWPERRQNAAAPVDWQSANTWTFEPLDEIAFPAVELARRAGQAGGTAPAVFNAANEACVDAFCERRLSFTGITTTIGQILDEHLASGHIPTGVLTLSAVLSADNWARQRAAEVIDAGAND
jgi:1-deoxy-D-xylulose-5-phosphate reductoisomerase